MQSTILADFDRLELERADLDPQPGALDVRGRCPGTRGSSSRRTPTASSR